MAKDPAFLFYPGDYLRDTQCLSEAVQVAYDRIMCEHMRNICISKQQLKFFTKKLSEDETEELKMVLTEIDGGFQITWVAESIEKRRAYSESRRKNRKSNKPKNTLNISKTYVQHMENENENENKEVINRKDSVKGKLKIEIPDYSEFKEYALEKKPDIDLETLRFKYESWVENDWQTGTDRPRQIKNWKTTLLNTLPHLKTITNGKQPTINRQTRETIESNSRGWEVK